MIPLLESCSSATHVPWIKMHNLGSYSHRSTKSGFNIKKGITTFISICKHENCFHAKYFYKQAWKPVGHIQLLSSCQWIIFIYLSMKSVFMQVSHTHIQPWKLSSCQWATLVYNHERCLHASKSFRNKRGYCFHDSVSFMEKHSWQASHSQTLGPCFHASKSFVNLH